MACAYSSGMFVVDYTTTSMEVVGEYDKNNVHAAGSGGIESGATTSNDPIPDLLEMAS